MQLSSWCQSRHIEFLSAQECYKLNSVELYMLHVGVTVELGSCPK